MDWFLIIVGIASTALGVVAWKLFPHPLSVLDKVIVGFAFTLAAVGIVAGVMS